MADIPLAKAVFLYKAGFDGEEPKFTVRPLGHDDYYSRDYTYSVGACFRRWQETAEGGNNGELLARMFIDIWHAAAFYEVPIQMIHEAMLVVPEYRNMLADDCLPREWQFERK
ncbi:hypothetical protein [Qipengyuania atrilutea]|uniref:Uncharacterized protein n=1 Tax=Qipengyuania atrilutea TaxID=2744473 RepID=A0A850H0K7_9SPHN|nr:hypothetical protein [Actirhodobacter atriluteus]NVD43473.1 hypothetical protein [Actirhodobacter atriluteus]